MRTNPKVVLAVRVVVGIGLAAFALALPYQNNYENNRTFGQVLYLAVAAMGLNLLTGFNGQVSIGHGAFFGVGAFTTAILVHRHGMPPEATIPIAAVVAGAFGAAVGFPALRVKGLYLALVTLGLSVAFPDVANRFLGGSVKADRGEVASLITGMDADIYQYYVCLVVAVLLFALVASLARSRTGRAMVAVRDQEVAASTVGISVARVKVITFALSAAYAGVAGSLSIFIDRTASASNPTFYFQKSIEFLIALVIGGVATISGPLLGAILLTWIKSLTEKTDSLGPAVLGGALILTVYVLPDGIVGGLRRLGARLRAAGSASGGDPPSLVATGPEPPAPATQ